MRLLHNISSLNIYSAQNKILEKQGKALKAISSGYKVSSAADDPNTIATSEKLRLQIRGLQVASQNVQNGVSMLQTVDGGLGEIQSVIQRVRSLVVQGENGTNTPEDKDKIQTEINVIQKSIGDITKTTEFNGVKLINNPDVADNFQNGNFAMQVGANAGENVKIPSYNLQDIYLKFNPLKADGTTDDSKYFLVHMSDLDINHNDISNSAGTGAVSGINLDNITLYDSSTNNAIGNIDAASAADAMVKTLPSDQKEFGALDFLDNVTDSVSSIRAKYGALENRFTSTFDSINDISGNMEDADSNIRDADIASEMLEYSKDNILANAGSAMLAQSNNFPQDILKILENVRSM